MEIVDFLECEEIAANYKPYNGEELLCKNHYILTEHDGNQFLQLNNHCADLVRSFVINDFCIDICDTEAVDDLRECMEYNANIIRGEVVLIAK